MPEVKLVTTITTYIETSASIEEARSEIFDRYKEDIEERAEEILTLQGNCVVFDTILGTEVSHTFGEASE